MEEHDFSNYRTYDTKAYAISVEEALRIIENPETSDAMREYLLKKVKELQTITIVINIENNQPNQ